MIEETIKEHGAKQVCCVGLEERHTSTTNIRFMGSVNTSHHILWICFINQKSIAMANRGDVVAWHKVVIRNYKVLFFWLKIFLTLPRPSSTMATLQDSYVYWGFMHVSLKSCDMFLACMFDNIFPHC
jgi:hypothetical protein